MAQIVNIPDPNFKIALLANIPTIDTNNDGEIQASEALATTSITVVGQGVTSIEGIEAFLNLERLFCFNNPITSVDLSSNTQLQQINFTFANLTSIDLSANTLLSSVSLGNTSISQIDVSMLPSLELLDMGATNLSTIDVSNNSLLLSLILNFTNVSSLDLSNNTAIEGLGLRDTGLSSFDFSIVPNLKTIIVNNTNFENLDFSNNTQLCSLSARDCPLLETINIQNGNNPALAVNQDCSIQFTIGGSSATSGIFADTGNPNLEFICVDDIQFANDNFDLVPNQTQFVEDCSLLSIDEFNLITTNLLSNPVANYLTLESTATIKMVVVYGISGEKINTQSFDNDVIEINVSALSSGVYFASIHSETGAMETIKFIKE